MAGWWKYHLFKVAKCHHELICCLAWWTNGGQPSSAHHILHTRCHLAWPCWCMPSSLYCHTIPVVGGQATMAYFYGCMPSKVLLWGQYQYIQTNLSSWIQYLPIQCYQHSLLPDHHVPHYSCCCCCSKKGSHVVNYCLQLVLSFVTAACNSKKALLETIWVWIWWITFVYEPYFHVCQFIEHLLLFNLLGTTSSMNCLNFSCWYNTTAFSEKFVNNENSKQVSSSMSFLCHPSKRNNNNKMLFSSASFQEFVKTSYGDFEKFSWPLWTLVLRMNTSSHTISEPNRRLMLGWLDRHKSIPEWSLGASG